jgi:hypothetical protein
VWLALGGSPSRFIRGAQLDILAPDLSCAHIAH